ncbi:MAG: VWA domain-containing protein [Vicinamibacterales bacterium]
MMTRYPVVVAAVLLLAGIMGSDLAGQAGDPLPSRQSYLSTTTAILVDVVVRDGKGRPVTDLSAADFQVAEDGVAQTLDTFTRASRGGGIGVGVAWRSRDKVVTVNPGADNTAPEDVPTAAVAEDDGTTAIVYDHLSSESLRLAQTATLDHIPMTHESSVRVGIFATDPGIRVVQRYTTDRTLVRQAVARVLPSSNSADDQKVDRADELLARRRELQGQSESAAARAATGTGAALARNASEMGERETERRLIQTELNMMRSFDNLDREHRGYDTSLALMTVVQSLSNFPGRKTIVFFSEGLPASPALSARLDAVIDAANRANVTAYAVDAGGLRTRSALTNMRKEMQAFADDRFSQLAAGTDRTDQPLTMAFERVEDTLRLDSRTGLARLAEDTGGFLVEQSNDLSSAFRRIDEDNRFHYLLTYSPKNTDFDGKFRKIQVKVRRPGTQVFARKGYRAIRRLVGIDAGSYEIPALALLDRAPLPNTFPVHAAGFSFPDPARPGLTPVLVHVRTDALRFTVDPRRSTYSGQAAIVVRIRDGQGQEVQKLSQQYLLAGEAKDLDAAKNGDILFYREVDLSPGVYTMESIVFDAAAHQGSARVATLTVPDVELPALGMSSLVLVSRVEEVNDPPAGESRGTAPLYVGRTLLYPNLGQPISKSGASELPFYFTVYGRVDGVKVYAQLLRNGEALAEAPVDLGPAVSARIQHVGRLPIGALPVGTYELRIRVNGGGHEVSRAAFFTLTE